MIKDCYNFVFQRIYKFFENFYGENWRIESFTIMIITLWELYTIVRFFFGEDPLRYDYQIFFYFIVMFILIFFNYRFYLNEGNGIRFKPDKSMISYAFLFDFVIIIYLFYCIIEFFGGLSNG